MFHGDGALLLDHETRQIEDETNPLTAHDVIKLELDIALDAGIVEPGDFTNALRGRRGEADRSRSHPQRRAQSDRGPHVRRRPADAGHGPDRGALPRDVHPRAPQSVVRRPSPAPNPEALRLLTSTMHEGGYDIGLAMDGDADRIAIVDEQGEYISINDVLLLLYWYMHEVRGERGGVVRNLSTTHLLDRLAHPLGEECYEVPVGFKHIV